MRPLSLAALLIAFALPSLAHADEKSCVVNPGSDLPPKIEFRITFSPDKIVVKNTPSSRGYLSGDFEAFKNTRISNGVKQIGFDGYDEDEGVVFWVDEALLQPRTTGTVNLDTHGGGDAGTTNSTLTCR